jgi:pyridoxamine 5'-phosphate oxidase family protein
MSAFTGFSAAELAYLRGGPPTRLGRLATVDGRGVPQNSPVGFRVEAETNTIVIGGYALGTTRKFRNVAANPYVSLVVDDVASTDPWRVRAVEVRGEAEALTDVDPVIPGTSRELIRIHPTRVVSWGLDGD